MTNDMDMLRVVLAVTESSRISDLWHAATEAMQGTPAELVAVFIDDERWRRAASLPFTREFAKLGGTSTDFTSQRAEELFGETASRIRQQIDRLAAESGQVVRFETLAEADDETTHRLVGRGKHVFIASATLTRYPIYTELTRLKLNIRLVGSDTV